MTKRELIRAIEAWDDNAEVKVAWACKCGTVVFEDIASLTTNGKAIQLNTESMEAKAFEAWKKNRKQNGKEV